MNSVHIADFDLFSLLKTFITCINTITYLSNATDISILQYLSKTVELASFYWFSSEFIMDITFLPW